MSARWGHSNNALGPLVVPRLPMGKLAGRASFDRRRGRGLASIPRSRAEEHDMAAGNGVEILGPPADRFDEILTPDALNLIAALHRELGGRRGRAAGRPGGTPAGTVRGRHAGLPARDGRHQGRPKLAGDAARARPGGPASGDHRPDRAQDDHQRAQLGRERLAGRLRGREHPALGEHGHRPAQPVRRPRPDDRLHQRGGQVLPAASRRRAGHDRGPAARLAPGREAPAGGRPAGVRQPVRLRAVLLPLRAAPARQGRSARTSTWPRPRATWRRGSGTTPSTWPRTRWASRAARSAPRC